MSVQSWDRDQSCVEATTHQSSLLEQRIEGFRFHSGPSNHVGRSVSPSISSATIHPIPIYFTIGGCILLRTQGSANSSVKLFG